MNERIRHELRAMDTAKVTTRLLLLAFRHARKNRLHVTPEMLHHLVYETVRQVKAGRHSHRFHPSKPFFCFLGRVLIVLIQRATSKAEKRKITGG